ncbi:Dynein assembly factor with WDR repeat domains 1 [Perkinsus olseni]|uniref:Dynein assembly factor with WDR repeat domains 1 n=1 Tax=Perkinsus olseni TaxID=32597 RepID=A0A7J6THV0_PEROL|nr:Dynein assembly factor with WDR repeat domains 1 [Perkinsus olseni]
MKLRRFLLRYYPPGIILEYQRRNGDIETKSVDLLTLSPESDVDALVDQIILEEPLLSDSKKDVVRKMIYKLMDKLDGHNRSRKFYLYKILRAHILPLTNCAFNKSGSKFITGSYDRTCRVWDTMTGDELVSLEGHRNVVYALAFNNPFGDKIITGSFDKTARIWDAESGQCLHVLVGHTTEIVCVAFSPRGTVAATGSMDRTAKLWSVETGKLATALQQRPRLSYPS